MIAPSQEQCCPKKSWCLSVVCVCVFPPDQPDGPALWSHYIIWPGQQKRLKAISGILVRINHSDVAPDSGLIFSSGQMH